MNDKQQRVRELLIELQALLAQDEKATIPAGVFRGKHTPLQAAALHLEGKGFSTKELSRLLLRPSSVVKNALLTGRAKGPLPLASGPEIRVDAFQDLRLTPGEAVVLALHKQGLRNKDVALALGQDARNTWTLLDNARKKTGGAL